MPDDWYYQWLTRLEEGDRTPLAHDEAWWQAWTLRLEAAAVACGWIEPETTSEEPEHG